MDKETHVHKVEPQLLHPIRLAKSHMLSYSALSSYMTCPRKYLWQYGWKLELRTPNVNFIVGKAFHSAVEYVMTCWKQEETPNAKTIIERVNKEFEIPEYQQEFINADLQAKIEYGQAQATACALAWFYNNLEPPFKVLSTEFEFTMDYVCIIGSVSFTGIIDGIIEDKEGNVAVIEHKTKSLSWGTSWIETLETDLQSCMYLGAAYDMGLEPKYFIYNVCDKPKERSGKTQEELISKMREGLLAKADTRLTMDKVIVDNEQFTFCLNQAATIAYRLQRSTSMLDFPCYLTNCIQFNSKCPYWELCRNRIDPTAISSVMNFHSLNMFCQKEGYNANKTDSSKTD